MARRSAQAQWLSVTPEPERELPWCLAALRAGHSPGPPAVAAERERLENLVLRGTERRWLAYLAEAVDLLSAEGRSADPAVARARAIAVDVIRNHHALLLGLAGDAAERTAAERARLEAAAATLRTETSTQNGAT